jgi:lauroyl-KDO2-lipid IV(A) myristoyltransferase
MRHKNFSTESPAGEARAMNQFIEQYCEDKPEQYMWNLKLLKTQTNNQEND